jgi:LPXTG-motif cell wall-anchored protein
VLEPAEGATITGGVVRVVVNTEIPAERDTKRDANSMPRPRVDIFIDDNLKGTLKDENNVLSVDAVSPGAHKLVVLAKNMSGEVIDRKEIKFSTVAAMTETTTTERSTSVERPATSVERPAPTTQVQSAPPPPPPAPAPKYVPPPAPAPAPVAVAEEHTTTRRTQLPATGTSDLALGAAGLALLVGGFALRRRA